MRRDLHRSQGPACLLWTPGLPAQGRTPSSAARRPGTLVKAVPTYAPTGTLLRRPAGWLWAAVRPSLQGPGRGLPLARGVGQKPVPICTFGLTSWAVFSSPGLGDAAAGPLGTPSPMPRPFSFGTGQPQSHQELLDFGRQAGGPEEGPGSTCTGSFLPIMPLAREVTCLLISAAPESSENQKCLAPGFACSSVLAGHVVGCWRIGVPSSLVAPPFSHRLSSPSSVLPGSADGHSLSLLLGPLNFGLNGLLSELGLLFAEAGWAELPGRLLMNRQAPVPMGITPPPPQDHCFLQEVELSADWLKEAVRTVSSNRWMVGTQSISSGHRRHGVC